MQRVSGSIQGNVRGEQAVVADGDDCGVNDRAVIVDEQVFPDPDSGAVIAVKGRVDAGVF